MNWPSVAIVVLNWNGREYLSECLTSAGAQTYPGAFEVVLVDNGSDDGSAAHVESAFPRVRLIRSPVNRGFAAGNNLAARHLDAELFAFLNNDTRVEPTWLQELVAVLMAAPDIACAGGKIMSWDGQRIDFVGGGSTLTGFGLQFDYGEAASEHDRERDILFACGGSMVVRRAPYLQVGGLDDDYFLFYEDVDLGWRFWLAGHRVRFAPKSVAYHRHHGGTRRFEERRLAVLYERNALYTIYKNYDDAHLAAVLPAAILLAAEKAASLADIDRTQFLIPAVPAPAPAGDRVRARRASWKKVRASLRERGLVNTSGRILRAAKARALPATLRWRGRLARRIAGRDETVSVPAAAVSRLVALEEFGKHLPELREKRRAVQRLRRRSDDEILDLFGLPLEPGFGGPGFSDYHRRLMRAFELDTWAESRHGEKSSISRSGT